MRTDWKDVARFGSLVEAEIAAGRLDSGDIPYVIDQRDAVGLFGPGHSGSSVRGVVLKVPADMIEAARRRLRLDPD
ncbi:MAG: putative signal transducing protein [Gemmatimonadota bacterium]